MSEPDVTDIAAAVLDGGLIDWPTVESAAHETDRSLLEQLRVLATLAEFHRDQHASCEQTWGHLQILEPIGGGSFGRVYRAWDSRLDRHVALKLLPAASDVGDARASSIIEEGRLLARVRHPNVVTIYGAQQIGDTVGLWMELIDGETVEQRLAQGPLQPSDVIDIGLQICDAVSAVHKAGLLHRDIKAQNVMLAKDGRAVLMDFGSGWDVRDAAAPTESLAGTPLYLAPELLRGGATTVHSDIYSIGVLLYHMLTSTYPVGAQSLPDLRAAHERRERTPAVKAQSNLPRRLGRIIERAIQPQAERRYERADALAAALASVKRRPSFVLLTYATAATAAVVLGGWLLADHLLHRDTQPPSNAAMVSGTSGVSARSDAVSIAVLPLKNLSTDADSEEVVDGFTEEIINGLAAYPHLHVRARASSFAFKNKPRDLDDVVRQLGVSLVIEGSVRRSGKGFQIETRLVQVPSGVVLWDERFDTDFGGGIAIRDRVTRGVVTRLGLEPSRVRREYGMNPDAYERYLAARALVSRRGVSAQQKAVEYFQQVIAIAPEFAPAYAGLADAYAYMSLPTYQGMPLVQAQQLMRTAALKALELDPNLAEAHAAMGVVYARDLDWPRSQQQFQQAIALNPSLSQVYTSYSFFTLRPLRKFEDDEHLLRVALQNDPLSLDVWREMGELDLTVGRYDEAINLLQQARAVDPHLPTADVILARALALRGRVDEALALYDVAHGPPHYHAYAYVRAGRRSDAERLAAENHQFPYRAAIIYAALGDADRAFEALNRTAEQEPQRVPLLLTWPEIAPLWGDPRLSAIRKRFRLP